MKIQSAGTTILVTDHNVKNLFDITDRSYVLGEQTVIAEGTSRELLKSPTIEHYFEINSLKIDGFKAIHLIINKKISSFKKTIIVDADKSISIRSFLIGSISQNISVANNVLASDDVYSTINCLKQLGVKIKKYKEKYFIFGKGLGSLRLKKNDVLNFGNSGTLARLLIGILTILQG